MELFSRALGLKYSSAPGRTVRWWVLRSKKFERAVLNDVPILVQDGCLQVNELQTSVLSREQPLVQLR